MLHDSISNSLVVESGFVTFIYFPGNPRRKVLTVFSSGLETDAVVSLY